MKRKNKCGKRIFAFFLSMVMCFCLMPASAFALPKIDTSKDVSLKITYADGSKSLSNVDFSIYRVAEVTEEAKCRLVGDFEKYADVVTLKGLDAVGWKNAALTLKGYVQRDDVPATKTAKTDASGEFTLENLETGLYLVLGDRIAKNGYIYTAEPVLLFLPGRNEASGVWEYDVSVRVKYSRDHSGGGGGGDDKETVKSWKVLKVWKDAGHQKERPAEVEIDLLRDGQVFDSVTLKEGNNWRYTWKNLSDDYEWMVVEKDAENYTTSIARDGETFVVTNTYDEEEPDGGDPKDPQDENPDEDEEEGMVLGAYDFGEILDAEEILPQTGALWWPVPVLGCGGLILIMVGFFVKRRQMDEEE